jgi:DNA-binding NarL/FixJ family response regulator
MAEPTDGGATGPIRVVIVDDHAIWRSGVRADLGDAFTVVGEADNAHDAIDVIAAVDPDLVLCDLHMPGGGRAVIRACGEDVPIVVLTVSEAERDVLDAVADGAVGYLVTSTSGEELRDGLLHAARGEPVFSPSLAALVLGEFRRLRGATGPVEALTDREREVLSLVARGHTYR